MFFLRSLVFSTFSPAFYKEAVACGGKKAFGVYTLFIFLVTLVSALVFVFGFGLDLKNMLEELEAFPDVVVEDGELYVDAEMPIVYAEKGQYFAVDTTGTINEIPQGYAEGVLFTRTEMIARSKNEYGDQSILYIKLLEEFNTDRIEITAETIAGFLRSFGLIFMCIFPVIMFIWNFFWNFFLILIVATVGYFFLNAKKLENAFSKSFVLSVYAFIPVFYTGLILKGMDSAMSAVAGISIAGLCCLIPLGLWVMRWGVFWGLGASGVLHKSA